MLNSKNLKTNEDIEVVKNRVRRMLDSNAEYYTHLTKKLEAVSCNAKEKKEFYKSVLGSTADTLNSKGYNEALDIANKTAILYTQLKKDLDFNSPAFVSAMISRMDVYWRSTYLLKKIDPLQRALVDEGDVVSLREDLKKLSPEGHKLAISIYNAKLSVTQDKSKLSKNIALQGTHFSYITISTTEMYKAIFEYINVKADFNQDGAGFGFSCRAENRDLVENLVAKMDGCSAKAKKLCQSLRDSAKPITLWQFFYWNAISFHTKLWPEIEKVRAEVERVEASIKVSDKKAKEKQTLLQLELEKLKAITDSTIEKVGQQISLRKSQLEEVRSQSVKDKAISLLLDVTTSLNDLNAHLTKLQTTSELSDVNIVHFCSELSCVDTIKTFKFNNVDDLIEKDRKSQEDLIKASESQVRLSEAFKADQKDKSEQWKLFALEQHRKKETVKLGVNEGSSNETAVAQAHPVSNEDIVFKVLQDRSEKTIHMIEEIIGAKHRYTYSQVSSLIKEHLFGAVREGSGGSHKHFTLFESKKMETEGYFIEPQVLAEKEGKKRKNRKGGAKGKKAGGSIVDSGHGVKNKPLTPMNQEIIAATFIRAGLTMEMLKKVRSAKKKEEKVEVGIETTNRLSGAKMKM